MEERINELISILESEERMYVATRAHGPGFVRFVIEEYPEVKELIEIGDPAAEILLNKFKDTLSSTDVALSCFAYVLEKLDYKSAVPTLINFLKDYVVQTPVFWAPHLVAHALKVLTSQEGIDEKYYSYNTQEREETIRLAEDWLKKI
ncbi:MAG: hypothetical protein ACE5KE_11275 [Methanosarcinales archaeon]